jgi:hypothetical protein
MVVLGLVFWAIGERNRRRGLVGISIAARATATALPDAALPDPEN